MFLLILGSDTPQSPYPSSFLLFYTLLHPSDCMGKLRDPKLLLLYVAFAALSISIPTFRISESKEKEAVQILLEAKQRIETHFKMYGVDFGN